MSGRALLAGLFAAVFGALAGTAAAQQPPDDVDARSPLPPEAPKRPSVPGDYRFPNKGARIFTEIKDHYPVQSEKQNRDEYQAWTEAVHFARTRTAAGLEQHAARDLTPEDLVQSVSTKRSIDGQSEFRLDLVRFDGRLTSVRRVEPSKALAEGGLKDLYEGRLVPVDESPSRPVFVVFTDLPAGLDLGEQHDRWVTFAGYFFKVLAYPGPTADVRRDPNPADPAVAGWLPAPVLVGRSVTLLGGPPAEVGRVAINKDLRIFRRIRDDAPASGAPWEEGAAWDRVVLHARKFSTAELEAAARRDVGFPDLFKKEHRLDYQLELVHFEGRLIWLRRGEKPRPRLTEAGVTEWYEGWLIPKDEPAGNPVCIVLTELPKGLEPSAVGQRPMSHWVTFAGYSFKLMKYESKEDRKDVPGEKQWKVAPLLIGRSVTLRDDPAAAVRDDVRYGFVWPMVGGLAAVVGVALGLGWYFRRGDRRVRSEVEARTRNPFGESPA